MEATTSQSVDLLKYLLPGFVVAWVFFGLTAQYRPDKFERVIQALIFSLFVQTLVALSKCLFLLLGRSHSIGEWTDTSQELLSVAYAILLGLAFSWAANSDSVHKLLRKAKITKQTSHPSEWFGAFNDMEKHVVLHLKGERRMIGWAREWPNRCSDGHFVMVDAAWLGDDNMLTELSGDQAVLIPAIEVELVEFLNDTKEAKHDAQRTQAEPIS
jgi:hypothetical protein